ncbi:MAG: hypothetical protein N3D84_02690, partial [Candidatus Woesearchaeota archaeon]|nr:hypothetical protein [Candidatus Woesearchaeota archaeon]
VLGGVFIKGIKKIKHYGIVYLIGCVKIYIIVRLIMLLDIGLISFVLLNFFFISIVMAWMRLGMARAGTNIV